MEDFQWINMGGYGQFVWASYAFTLAVIIGMVARLLWRYHRLSKQEDAFDKSIRPPQL